MRTFQGMVSIDGQLYNIYSQNGETYVEPINSASEANAVLDNRQDNTQENNNTQIANQVLNNMQGGTAGSSMGLSSGASEFGGATQGMTVSNVGSYGSTSGIGLGAEAPAGYGGASQGGISGMSSGTTSGMGAMGYAGIVAAAIAAQHYMSNNTNREFEGVKTDDAFSGNFLTEPWQAYMYEKMGIDTPTSGENFDAAVENKDWSSALRRAPAAFAHDPLRETIYDSASNKWGKTTAAIIDPMSALLNWIGG